MSRPLSEELFAAAREDSLTGEVRDRVWSRVNDIVSIPPAPPPAPAPAPPAMAAPATVKLVALGAVLGAASAVAVGLALSAGGGGNSPSPSPKRTLAVVDRGPSAGARLAEAPVRARAERATERVPALAAPKRAELVEAAGAVDEGSALAEEARIVGESRRALVEGDPERALALVRSTRGLPSRALEPEELGLEARALRALSRTDEALATELLLRRRFPSHALSR